jgi:hypothetical protein
LFSSIMQSVDDLVVLLLGVYDMCVCNVS